MEEDSVAGFRDKAAFAAAAALRAYAAASKEAKCPICAGTESCDHSVKERLLADLGTPPLHHNVAGFAWSLADENAKLRQAINAKVNAIYKDDHEKADALLRAALSASEVSDNA